MSNFIMNDPHKTKVYELINIGRIDAAIKMLRKICRANKYDDEAWLLAGDLNARQGEYRKAIKCFGKAVKLCPKNDQAHFMLGFAYQYLGRYSDAGISYRAAIRINPSHSKARYNLGTTLLLLYRFKEAEKVCLEALKLDPDNINSLLSVGSASYSLDKFMDAGKYFNRVLELDPKIAEAHYNLARVLSNQKKLPQALSHYKIAAHLKPNFIDAVVGEVSILTEMGDIELAGKRLEPYSSVRNTHSNMALAFAILAKGGNQQHEAIESLEQVLESGISSVTELRRIHFQLGKLYDQVHLYDKAFKYYRKGNLKEPNRFDCTELRRYIDQTLSAFSQQNWRQLPHAVNDSELPVFIVGMPRSGKTLLEKILSSHTQVSCAGELEDMSKIIDIVVQQMGKPFPLKVEELSIKQLNELASIYLSGRQAEALPGIIRITDTMPFNVDRLGFIRMLFPHARIIHCRREPRDMLLECYFKDFQTGHFYSYDLLDLGYRYQQYHRVCQHWENILSPPYYVVDYEELVRKPEIVIRQLIEYMGLEWQPQCLEFYKENNTHFIGEDTFDEPLNQHSIGRWKNYQQYLQPLFDALK